MALINWSEEYSVKVREIDNQHKKLINIINELHDKMKEGKGKEVIGKTLSELVDYTVFHFSYEEKLFASNNYPEFKIHARQHSDLIDQVKVYLKKLESGDSVLALELMNFLKKWLVDHIMVTDKKYSAFFNAKGIS